mmetsp:Transcript_62614/g.201917  ORF Transcript_62614/g.201917 Transcript_62614/m.201917 type:complete len:200 (-) Transcript_62614:15-614(-)
MWASLSNRTAETSRSNAEVALPTSPMSPMSQPMLTATWLSAEERGRSKEAPFLTGKAMRWCRGAVGTDLRTMLRSVGSRMSMKWLPSLGAASRRVMLQLDSSLAMAPMAITPPSPPSLCCSGKLSSLLPCHFSTTWTVASPASARRAPAPAATTKMTSLASFRTFCKLIQIAPSKPLPLPLLSSPVWTSALSIACSLLQ